MKYVSLIFLILFLMTSCGISKTSIQIASGTTMSTKVIIPSQILTPAIIKKPTNALTHIPTSTPTRFIATTRTPYPIPTEILSNNDLQEKINEWLEGKIKLSDADRLLDEKTGKPIRLGILNEPLFGQVIFIFYNLGYSIIEDNNGTPYLLNIVGFEDGEGQRFTFPFHNGKLYSIDKSIILQEFNGRQINYGEKIFFDTLSTLQFLQKSDDLVGYINGGLSNIGNPDKGNESDIYMETSEKTTSELTSFLLCDSCSVNDIPEHLTKFIDQIPQKFDPEIPYLWEYEVAY